MESGGREIAVVLLMALLGVALAGAIVMAPWHPVEASTVVRLHQPR